MKTATLDKHDSLISSLSHGYRQRVGVAQALVHNPKLLILDEPTSGLDPIQIVEMRKMIRALRGAHTILLSSHILSEISQTCDRLLVIQQGQIVHQGTEQDLAKKTEGGGSIELEAAAPADRVAAIVRTIEGVVDVMIVRDDGIAALSLRAPPDLRPRVVRALVENGVDVLRIDRGAARLESLFIQLTKKNTELPQ
jgi:ABC-2 type transport system ATP-binding protein